MFTRKVLISLVFVIAFVLGGCSNLFGPGDSSDGDSVEKTYDVRFEITGTVNYANEIGWTMGDDEGASGGDHALPWEKESTCGEDEILTLGASSEEIGEITVTIYVDGDVVATSTGNWDAENEETAAVVSTRTPDPD